MSAVELEGTATSSLPSAGSPGVPMPTLPARSIVKRRVQARVFGQYVVGELSTMKPVEPILTL